MVGNGRGDARLSISMDRTARIKGSSAIWPSRPRRHKRISEVVARPTPQPARRPF